MLDANAEQGGLMISEMANIAAECLEHPSKKSVWSTRLNKYVCTSTPEGKEALVDQSLAVRAAHPGINPQFKLIFVTAAGGTAVFIVLCLVLSLIAGKEPPPLFEKIILGFFDMAKIGFGALVGLLGGKKLQGEDESSAASRNGRR
jgi:hypothetical protein